MINSKLISACLYIPKIRTNLSILEGRYYSTNNAIEKLGTDIGILKLALGLSPRELEMENKVLYYIESDLKMMIDNKVKITENVRKLEREGVSKNHYFKTINPISQYSLEQTAKLV